MSSHFPAHAARRAVVFGLTALACVLALGTPAPARAQVADAGIEIVAVDETNQVLPGVTITVTRPTRASRRRPSPTAPAWRASSRSRPAPTR